MFSIAFYEKEDGNSELWDFIEALRLSSDKNKNSRIQYKQIILYIQMLQDNGTMLSDKITKHVDDDIWELRPGDNRVLYFFCHNNTFVLLHHFRKKTKKTPRREIEKAKRERDDYLRRYGNEDMG